MLPTGQNCGYVKEKSNERVHFQNISFPTLEYRKDFPLQELRHVGHTGKVLLKPYVSAVLS